MTIQREDLAAAASVGLLQYRQIEPLLVFLLQRDVLAQRRALLAQSEEMQGGGSRSLLFYLLLFAMIAAGAVFAAMVTAHTQQSGGIGALFFFTGLYGFAAYFLLARIKMRSHGRSIRMLSTLMMASVPLAVFALQQMSN
jgi:hypothetical protein